jgi:peptidoglycan/LPS O-acetylase OafA/YrhL
MDAKPVPVQRIAFLDNIRILLTALVIVVHTAVTYGAPGEWYYMERSTGSLPPLEQLLFATFNFTCQTFFMGGFFLLAGYFTPASLERKGTAAFLRNRLLRLGVPLALFTLVLSPVALGFAQVMRGGHFLNGFRWVYTGHYECGPLWFVEALLIFSVVYAGWTRLFPAKPAAKAPGLPGHVTLVAAALLTGAATFAIRLLWPIGRQFLAMQPGYFATYIVLFFTGCLAARGRWLERIDRGIAVPWLFVAGFAVVILPLEIGRTHDIRMWFGGWNSYAVCYAFWEPFVAWGVLLGLLYVGRRYMDATSAFVSHLARCSFAVYVIHAPVLVGLAWLFHGWHAEPFLKWIVVAPLACAVSWTLASGIVRLPGLRRIFQVTVSI